MRVLVAIEPVDGRKGIDSLAQLCREKLAEDPFLCGGPQYVASARSARAALGQIIFG
jgi:transposase